MPGKKKLEWRCVVGLVLARDRRVFEREVELTWCISTVTVPPALTGHFPLTPLVPALHTTSRLPTLVTGELEVGRRLQVEP